MSIVIPKGLPINQLKQTQADYPPTILIDSTLKFPTNQHLSTPLNLMI